MHSLSGARHKDYGRYDFLFFFHSFFSPAYSQILAFHFIEWLFLVFLHSLSFFLYRTGSPSPFTGQYRHLFLQDFIETSFYGTASLPCLYPLSV
jgi:hypothetical protein